MVRERRHGYTQLTDSLTANSYLVLIGLPMSPSPLQPLQNLQSELENLDVLDKLLYGNKTELPLA